MKSERLDSLVRKLTPSIRETKLNCSLIVPYFF